MMKSVILPVLLVLFCAYQSAFAIDCPPLPGAHNGTAVISGDPHVRTLDGFKYHIATAGTFYLLRAGDGSLNIEAEIDTCNTNKFCTSRVAVQYNGALAVFDNDAITLTNAAGKITTKTDSHGAHYIVLSDGFTIRLNEVNSITNIFVPAVYYGRVNGLFGNFDDNAANDFTNPAGLPVPNLNAFLNAWSVPNGQNLFNNPNANIPPLDPNFTCTPGTNTGGNCQNARIQSVSHTNGETIICFAFKTPAKNTICSNNSFTSPANCPTCPTTPLST